MIVLDQLEQGSYEWHKQRLGVLTASVMDQLFTPTGKPSSQRERLICRLAAEIRKGEPVEEFMGNRATDMGLLLEPEAMDLFALTTGLQPQRVGFVLRDESGRVGCSPDWMLKDDSGEWVASGEMKCPYLATHFMYVRAGVVPQKYVPQTQFQLWVTGLDHGYFISYNPDAEIFIKKYEPDPIWMDRFDEEVPKVIAEVDRTMELA